MAERQPAHIEQALAEMAGAENDEQVKAARKRLAAAGYKQATAQARSEAAAGDDGSRKAAPKGRTTRQEAKGSTT
jgi:hypothetical protein